jgi:hypothetical protein
MLYARATFNRLLQRAVALRACYFIRILQRVDCFTRVLNSVYIHGAGLLSALQLSCVYRSMLTVSWSSGKGLF